MLSILRFLQKNTFERIPSCITIFSANIWKTAVVKFHVNSSHCTPHHLLQKHGLL